MSDRLDMRLPPLVRNARARAEAAANGVLPHLHAIDSLPPKERAAWDEVDDALREMTDSLRQWNDSIDAGLKP